MMSNDDRAARVARYVGGLMDADERRRFEEQLHADPLLRKMTEAEGLIQRVAAADRAAASSIPSASRERFQKMVASLPTTAPSRKSRSSLNGWLHLSVDLLLLLAMIALLRVARSEHPSETPPEQHPGAAQLQPTPPAPTSANTVSTNTVSANAVSMSALPQDTARSDSASARRRQTARQATRRDATSNSRREPAGVTSTRGAGTTDSLQHTTDGTRTMVIGSDSTTLPMMMRAPKINQRRSKP